jgi:hypothetical protein
VIVGVLYRATFISPPIHTPPVLAGVSSNARLRLRRSCHGLYGVARLSV